MPKLRTSVTCGKSSPLSSGVIRGHQGSSVVISGHLWEVKPAGQVKSKQVKSSQVKSSQVKSSQVTCGKSSPRVAAAVVTRTEVRLHANISITRSEDSRTESVFVSLLRVACSRLSAEGRSTLKPHSPAEPSPVTVPNMAPCNLEASSTAALAEGAKTTTRGGSVSELTAFVAIRGAMRGNEGNESGNEGP